MLSKTKEKRTRYVSTMHLEKPEVLDHAFFQQNLPQCYRAILFGFKKISHSFVKFHLWFVAGFAIELCLFFSFLPWLLHTNLVALALGGFFLTGFSYFVLLFYYQAKKPEQFLELCQQFLNSCKQMLPPGEHHLSVADALVKLAAYLQDFELHFYKTPKILTKFVSYSAVRFFKTDVFQMKLFLLEQAVKEHFKQIRLTPTDLEVHASLANTYVALSKVYKAANDLKYKDIVRLAIEEFSILSQYAPNDPWVHEQLATGYCDLEMPVDETREMEILLKLRVQDKEVLYRLGQLYFKQNLNAKGLQVYEELKKANFKKAEELISSYGLTQVQ